MSFLISIIVGSGVSVASGDALGDIIVMVAVGVAIGLAFGVGITVIVGTTVVEGYTSSPETATLGELSAEANCGIKKNAIAAINMENPAKYFMYYCFSI
jgi:hypothetical protein